MPPPLPPDSPPPAAGPGPLNGDQLAAFEAVAVLGSYRAASSALCLTQSAITARVQALERHLGQRLFRRAGRGVTLAPAGERLLAHCRALAGLEATLRADLAGGALHGRLTLACGSALAGPLLAACRALGTAHPGLDLTLRVDDEATATRLLSGEADLLVGEQPLRHPGLHSRRLGALAYGLAAAPTLLAPATPEPPAQSLLGHHAIDFAPADRLTLDLLATAHPDADWGGLRRHFVNDTRLITEWVLAGAGFSALPLRVVAPLVEAGRLVRLHPAAALHRDVYVTRWDGPVPPALHALEAAIIDFFD